MAMVTVTERTKRSKMKKVLVTGGGGQLGRSFRNLPGTEHFTFVSHKQLDICDTQAVADMICGDSYDIIINCAAYTNVDGAESDKSAAMRVNRDGAANLAAAALSSDALLVHISTDYVFDSHGNIPLNETDPCNPSTVYGRTKLEGERAILASGCRHIIIRTSWLYSEYGSNFLKTMLRLTSEHNQIKVVFDQVGTPTYAADLALAVLKILQRDTLSTQGIYHFSNEGAVSWYDFACEINRLAGHNCHVEPCLTAEFPRPARRPSYSVLDKQKIRETFGLSIPHWRESLDVAVKNLYCLQ